MNDELKALAKTIDKTHPDLSAQFWAGEQNHIIVLTTEAVVPISKTDDHWEHFPKMDRSGDEVQKFSTWLRTSDGLPSDDQVQQAIEGVRGQLSEARQKVKKDYVFLCKQKFKRELRYQRSAPGSPIAPLLDYWKRRSNRDIIMGDALTRESTAPMTHITDDGKLLFVALWVKWEDDHVIVTMDDIDTLVAPMPHFVFQGIRQASGMTPEEFAEFLSPDEPLQDGAVSRWETNSRGMDIPEAIANRAAQAITDGDDLTNSIVDTVRESRANALEWPLLQTFSADEAMPVELTECGVSAETHRLATCRAFALLRNEGIHCQVLVVDPAHDVAASD